MDESTSDKVWADMQAEEFEEKWWLCKGSGCNTKLGEKIDENHIKILGINAQEYEVGFNYIRLFCKKCGKENYLGSEISSKIREASTTPSYDPNTGNLVQSFSPYSPIEAEITPVKKAYFDLSPYHTNKILKELSQKQKLIFKELKDKKVDTRIELERAITEISQEQKIQTGVVKKDVELIIKKIKEVIGA